MPHTYQAEGNNLRNAVSAAKKLIGNVRLRMRVVSTSGDNLFRVTLDSGDVVEVTLIHHETCSARLVN